TLKQVGSVKELILRLQKIIQQLEIGLSMGIPAGVKTGMVSHLAFLCESLKTNAYSRSFPDLETYANQHRLELNTVETVLMPLEKYYDINIPKDELAYIVQMIVENQLKLKS
ncbi:MAG: PRD domain-containing protein, partial [Carnobacterium sp.]|uniref:PRD domain-containing protein n=1 Tax=Carnobacterium sp. TaxID=48221 RepID=UPI002FC5B17E